MAYTMVSDFATGELATLLQIDPSLASRTFLLGRLFQSLMGVRFRVSKSLSEAEPYFQMAERHLKEILS
jgi:hypothetical protein